MSRVYEGMVVGRLTVLTEANRSGYARKWVCLCTCGHIRIVSDYRLTCDNPTRSCGCLRKEAKGAPATHGMSSTPEYRVWANLKDRCCNPKHPKFRHYGGRGITVCPEWLNSFEAFFSHVGPRPSDKHSLERVRNNEGYKPGNVTWATAEAQNSNRRMPKLRRIAKDRAILKLDAK